MFNIGQQITNELTNNQYKIIKKLGKGTSGIIYEALNIINNQIVALKISDEIKNNETIVLDQLIKITFKHVLNIYEHWIDQNNNLIIIMELGNECLYDYLKQELNNKLNQNDILKLFYQIVFGVNELHNLQIMHRDLKPENIVTQKQSNGNSILKLIDTGLMKKSEKQRNTLNSGTPYYMAPEQIDSDEYNQRVDIWALGMILFEMLNENNMMIQGTSQFKVFEKIKYNKQDWFHNQIQNIKNCDQEIKDILKKMIMHNQQERNITTQEILEQLKKIGQIDSNLYNMRNLQNPNNITQQKECNQKLNSKKFRQMKKYIMKNFNSLIKDKSPTGYPVRTYFASNIECLRNQLYIGCYHKLEIRNSKYTIDTNQAYFFLDQDLQECENKIKKILTKKNQNYIELQEEMRLLMIFAQFISQSQVQVIQLLNANTYEMMLKEIIYLRCENKQNHQCDFNLRKQQMYTFFTELNREQQSVSKPKQIQK